MAPTDKKDGAGKYKQMSDGELRAECEKREIAFDEALSTDGLISLIIKDDNRPEDWGVIYARLMSAGLRYDEIPKRTFPQIKAILGEWANIISLRMPNIFGTPSYSSEPQSQQQPDTPPKLSQFAAMANMFDGIK